MKTTRNNSTKQSHQGNASKPRPEIRDDLDSRERKEGNYKGDKEQKGEKKPSLKKGA